VIPDRDAILKALEQVIDPELKRPVTDLDMVRVGLDRWEMETTLVEFVRERRLRKFS